VKSAHCHRRGTYNPLRSQLIVRPCGLRSVHALGHDAVMQREQLYDTDVTGEGGKLPKPLVVNAHWGARGGSQIQVEDSRG